MSCARDWLLLEPGLDLHCRCRSFQPCRLCHRVPRSRPRLKRILRLSRNNLILFFFYSIMSFSIFSSKILTFSNIFFFSMIFVCLFCFFYIGLIFSNIFPLMYFFLYFGRYVIFCLNYFFLVLIILSFSCLFLISISFG